MRLKQKKMIFFQVHKIYKWQEKKMLIQMMTVVNSKGEMWSSAVKEFWGQNWGYKGGTLVLYMVFWVFFFFFFCFFRATLAACEGSQAKGQIKATAASLHQSQQHQIRATSATYTTAQSNTGSLTHWTRPGIKSETSRFLVGFVSAAPWQELPGYFFCCFFCFLFLFFFAQATVVTIPDP